ncbi:hypothetical protein Tco_0230868 [Tanacetum coccineum]
MRAKLVLLVGLPIPAGLILVLSLLANVPLLWQLKHSTLDLSNPILSLLVMSSFLPVFFRNLLALIVSIAMFYLKSISSRSS